MKNPLFRRSNKSIDHSPTFNIPAKSDIAILPPKKVIEALYDWTPSSSDGNFYLSFSQGDFLHVVDREDDKDWYEACNPQLGHRGLVPVTYFKVLGKTVRSSIGSAASAASAPHDSGYPDPRAPQNPTLMSPPMPSHQPARTSMPRLAGPAGGAQIYGIVAYDFRAERPDELDAKEGEAIIVIAQSNPEWFVAKPITRLGGPGLIPVSFIEIKDMHTGETIQDTVGAIQRAGIPRVEEWKKMAAEFKNTSIPLGSIGAQPSYGIDGLNQGMQRMSMGNQSNGLPPATPYTPAHSQQYFPQQHQPQQELFTAVRASVPRTSFANDKFHFLIDVTLSNGTRWELARIYQDFYELQIELIKMFPEEAGKNDQPRVLPYMPGPVKFVTAKISEGRKDNLDEYLRDLLKLQPYISQTPLVCQFLMPRPGDRELNPDDPIPVRYSQHEQPQSELDHDPYSQARQRTSFPDPRSYDPTPQSATHPPMTRQTTQTSALSGPATPGALKVKVWFDIDTCVVVRMPPKFGFSYNDLYRKIVERRKVEYAGKKDSGLDPGAGLDDPELQFKYRDEGTGDYHHLTNDKDLEDALHRNEKLTLAVTAVASG